MPSKPETGALWPWTDRERREAERRARLVARRMGVCRHFNGYLGNTNTVCGAGVFIETVIQTNPTGWPPTEATRAAGMTIPCCQSLPCNAALNPADATCPHRVLRTRAEAIEYLAKEQENADRHY